MIKFDVFFLPHAKRQLLERGIAVEDVETVLLEPGQLLNTEIKGRKIK